MIILNKTDFNKVINVIEGKGKTVPVSPYQC